MTHQSVQRIESLLVPEARYNDAPLSASTTDNWVARHGGLPPMVRAIARALERSGKSESTAIATAIAAVKRWAAGGGNVHPSTRVRAAAAVAHWEASKLAAHASRQDDIAAKQRQALAILERRVGPHGYEHGWIKVSGDALEVAHRPERGRGPGSWVVRHKQSGLVITQHSQEGAARVARVGLAEGADFSKHSTPEQLRGDKELMSHAATVQRHLLTSSVPVSRAAELEKKHGLEPHKESPKPKVAKGYMKSSRPGSSSTAGSGLGGGLGGSLPTGKSSF